MFKRKKRPNEKQALKASDILIDFGLNYEKSTFGNLADIIYQLYTLFNPNVEIRYCDRLFKNGEIK